MPIHVLKELSGRAHTDSLTAVFNIAQVSIGERMEQLDVHNSTTLRANGPYNHVTQVFSAKGNGAEREVQ